MDSVRAKNLAKEVIGKKLGHWKVGDLIDNGKSAAVFHAYNTSGEHAAIKIFDRELVEKQGKEGQLERINREKRLVGKDNRNLIKILDGGYSKRYDFCYVVMEFLPGKTLSDVVPNFPPDQISSVINQIASAAHFLENLGLAHRDIKPENIRILDDMTPVLLDLGVLRPFKDSALTDGEDDNRLFIGTLQYSSPEFLLREEEDSVEGWRAITFYQIGAVLHDLIMLRPLFHNMHPYAKMVNAVQQTTPMISATNVSKELILLAKKCLLKDWRKRLECVDWSDFTEKSDTIDVDTIRDKILKNKVAAKAIQKDEAISSQDMQTAINLRLEELTESLLRVARKIRNQNKDVLPPLQVEVTKSCIPDGKHVVITFEPSLTFGLGSNLTIFLHIKLIEAKDKAVDIRACGKVSAVKQT